MARRGPKPTPRNLRIVKGTDKPSRVNEKEPIVPVSVPEPPDSLSAREAAVFTEHAQMLAKMRVMSDADVSALTIFARTWVEAQDAHDEIRKNGAVMQSEKGGFYHSPFWSIRNKAEDKALKILAEFGMTPSSRTRVNRT